MMHASRSFARASSMQFPQWVQSPEPPIEHPGVSKRGSPCPWARCNGDELGPTARGSNDDMDLVSALGADVVSMFE
jgi:hypothetical protein